MQIVTLDPTLNPLNVRAHRPDRILEGTIPQDRCKYVEYTREGSVCDWTELRIDDGVPRDAPMYHASYMEYLFDTWSSHLPFVIGPQHVWHTVTGELAGLIRDNAEAFRYTFTTSPDKTEISVGNGDPSVLPLEDLIRELRARMPGGAADVFLPTFTCDTPGAWMARTATFADACATYYDYSVYCCGHPRCKVLGERQDWEKLRKHVADLDALLGSSHPAVSPYLARVAEQLAPFLDEEVGALASHLSKIVTGEKCGSGSQYELDGWWTKLYLTVCSLAKVENFPKHVARVPYTDLQSKRKYVLCVGLFHSVVDEDGFYVPDFTWARNEVLEQPVRQVGALKSRAEVVG